MHNNSFDSVSLKLCDQLSDMNIVPNNDRGNDSNCGLGTCNWDKDRSAIFSFRLFCERTFASD